MNDEHGHRHALDISWAEPDLEHATPAWAGPAPDATHETPPVEPAAPAPQAPAQREGSMSAAWASWTSSSPAAPQTPAGQAAPATDEAESAAAAEPSQSEPAPTTGHTGHGATPVGSGQPGEANEPAFLYPQGEAHTPSPAMMPATENPETSDASGPLPTRQSFPDDEPDHGYDQSFMDAPAHMDARQPVADPELRPAPEPSGPPAPQVRPAAEQASPAPALEEDQPRASEYRENPSYQEPSHVEAPHHASEDAAYLSEPPQVIGQNDDVPEDALTIGRSRNNVIVLDDMLVSRRHVVITADEEGLLLRDLGSRNGTFVNGTRVEQTHIAEGDRIGIGASTFEVRDGWLVSV